MRLQFSLLMLLLLSACGGVEQDPVLEGTRTNVLGTETTLEPDATAANSAMQLPKAVENKNWPQILGRPDHAVGHISLPANVKRAWTTSVGNFHGHALTAPVSDAGRLFVLDSRHQVTALATQTGDELWQTKVQLTAEKGDASFPGGLAVAGNYLFVTTSAGQVFALTADKGEQVWMADVSAPLRAAPVQAGAYLFIVSHDNRLFALDVKTGGIVWTHSGISENLSLSLGGAAAVGEGAVAVPYTSGDVYVLRAADGQYAWHTSLTRVSDRLKNGVQSVAAAPVIDQGQLFAVNVGGTLAAFDLFTSRRLWRASIASSQTPWVAGNTVFVLAEDGKLLALNRADGAIRWISTLADYIPEDDKATSRYWSGPILAGERLIVASSDGYAMSLDPLEGSKILATRLVDDGVSVAPIVVDNTLYFLTDGGDVVAFR
ncbi:MAG: PQQ-binding-like beta-propeller repeat protein [Alphaproteobacteria bacterium]